MKKTYAFLATLLLASGVAAQNPTAYFMEGTTFRSQFNPAFAPLRGYVNIPGLGGIDINASGNLAVDKLLYPRNGKLVTLLDEAVSTRQALSGLKADNLLGIDTRVNLIGFGAFTRNHKNFWSFDLNARATADATLPYSLFAFLKEGTGSDIHNIGLTADSYLEAAFSYSFPLLNDRLYIGVRGKFLVGAARARMYFTRFNVTHGEEEWRIDAAGGLDITAAGLDVTTKRNDAGEEVYKLDDIDFKPTSPAGYGFAVDLGATYDILPNLQASLAVNDLGFIGWSKKKNVTGFSSKELSFTGRQRHGGRHRIARFRHRRAGISQRSAPKRVAHAARNDQRRTRIRSMAPQNRHRTVVFGPFLGVQDLSQHHRFGQFPPDPLVHAHGKLLGDRQSRRRRGAGTQPLPQLDQLLHRHGRPDNQTHAAVRPSQTEHHERHVRHRRSDRQTQSPHPGLRLRQGQTLVTHKTDYTKTFRRQGRNVFIYSRGKNRQNKP